MEEWLGSLQLTPAGQQSPYAFGLFATCHNLGQSEVASQLIAPPALPTLPRRPHFDSTTPMNGGLTPRCRADFARLLASLNPLPQKPPKQAFPQWPSDTPSAGDAVSSSLPGLLASGGGPSRRRLEGSSPLLSGSAFPLAPAFRPSSLCRLLRAAPRPPPCAPFGRPAAALRAASAAAGASGVAPLRPRGFFYNTD